jgi:hypothetical protein
VHGLVVSSDVVRGDLRSEGSKNLPDDGKLLSKHVGASIMNKGVVQSVHIVGHFYYG